MSAANNTTGSSFELITGGSDAAVQKSERELMAMQWLKDQDLEGVLISVEEVLADSGLVVLIDKLIDRDRIEKEAARVALKQAALEKLKAAMAAKLGHTITDKKDSPQEVPESVVIELPSTLEQKPEEFEPEEIPMWELQANAKGDIEDTYGEGFLPDYVWEGNIHNEAQYCIYAMRGVLISLIKPGQEKRRNLRAQASLNNLEQMLLKDVQAYCDFFQRYLDALKKVLCEYHGLPSSGYFKVPRKLFLVIDRELKRDKRFKAHLKLPTLKSAKAKMAKAERELERKALQGAIRDELLKHAASSNQTRLCKSIAKAAMAYLQDDVMDLEACLRDMFEHYLKGLPEKLPHTRLTMLASGTAADESAVTSKFMVIMQSMMDDHAFGAARIIGNFIKMSEAKFVDALKDRALDISSDDMEKGLPLWLAAGGDEESFLTALTERC